MPRERDVAHGGSDRPIKAITIVGIFQPGGNRRRGVLDLESLVHVVLVLASALLLIEVWGTLLCFDSGRLDV